MGSPPLTRQCTINVAVKAFRQIGEELFFPFAKWETVSPMAQLAIGSASLVNIYIYINDLEDDISSKVLKFADDTKVFRKVTNDTDKQSLQDDLDKLVKWSEKWQMLFHFGK